VAKNVLVLKHFESPKEAGTYYRLVCLTGPGKGESYILNNNRVVIGRGEKADIRINDAKASREHVELTKVGGNWVATDLGSQNGVLVNDKKITQHELHESDKLIVGTTVFKFAKVEVTGPKTKKEDREESPEEESKRSMMPFIILVLIFVALFLFDDFSGGEKPVVEASRVSIAEAPNEYMTAIEKRKISEDKQVKEKLNVIYQRGLREYREGNYFRAIHEFNLALIISPGDSQAEFYLRKTKEELDRSIEAYVAKAQRDEDSLKYQSAVVAYCSILRLLYSVPEDARFKNAEKKIKDLEEKIGMEPGETNCIKKPRTT
jgi:pSer/pThr/pTyr-binding forkhead associated (FHA) protein